MGPVELLAQIAAAAVFEEGHHPRHVQPKPPTLLAPIPGCLGQQLPQAGGQAVELLLLGEGEAPAVGGIEHVVAEGGGQLGQSLAGGIEVVLFGPLQAHAAQAHVPQFGLQDAALAGIEAGRSSLQGFQGPVDGPRLAGPVAKLHHRPLLPLVGGAQLGRVADAVEVADHPPAPAQPFAQLVERIHQLFPAQGGGLSHGQTALQVCFQGRELGVQLLEQQGDCLLHLLRCDRPKLGQAPAAQKGRGSCLDHGGCLEHGCWGDCSHFSRSGRCSAGRCSAGWSPAGRWPGAAPPGRWWLLRRRRSPGAARSRWPGSAPAA